MKLVCPKCLSSLKVPTTKVPAGGGWAKCPKCGERFFVRAPGQGPDLFSDSPRPAASRPLRRDEESQRLLDRIKAARDGESRGSRNEISDLGFPEVTIFPEPAVSPAVTQTIGITLLGLPLLLMTIIFFSSEPERQPPASTAAFDEQLNSEMKVELIRADLTALRRNMSTRGQTRYIVDFVGSESRVFKYFVRRLAPGRCDSFTRLAMESDRSSYGYDMTADCLEGNLERLKMAVTWTDRTARIRFPDYPEYGHDEFDMFPIRPMTAQKDDSRR